MNQSLRGMINIAAPVFAALLLEILPIYGILSIDVLTAIIAIFPLLFISIPQVGENSSKLVGLSQIWNDISMGFKFLIGWRGLLYLSLAATVLNFLIHPGFTFTPLLVTKHFGRGVVELSVIEAAFSVGMIIGGAMLSAWGGFKRKILTILTGIIGLAVGTGLVALAPSNQFYLAVIGMSLAGLMNPFANGPIFAIMQTYVKPELQGRVFSLLESMVSAMMPISMIIAAPVSKWIGVRGWLTFGACGCLFVGVAGFFSPSLMDIEDEGKKFL